MAMFDKDHVAISVGETFPENKKSSKISLKFLLRVSFKLQWEKSI